MIQVKRALKIMRVISIYRLDKLLDKRALPTFLRVLIAPAAFFGNTESNRGIRLRKALEELGPIFVKFGQLLSTRPDLIPSDICSELSKLQDSVPPFSSELFKKTVEDALGSKVDVIFKTFDDDPLASASIAQVHGAVMPDGRDIVVKAVRPGIEKIILEDLALLFTIAKLVQKYSPDGERLHPVEVVSDYQTVILTELNLQSEGANASLLRHNFEKSPLLFVPEIIWDYSNEKVLVMDRIYAAPVTDIDALRAANVDLKLLAERGVEIFFTQVFEHNFFHADMHPGNIFIQKHNDTFRFVLVDFGIMGSLSEFDKKYLAENFIAFFNRDYASVAKLHVECEWVPKDTNMPSLESAIRENCECMLDKPIKDVSLSDIIVNLFDTARRFKLEVQPQLILMQKTLLYTEGLGREFNPELDLWKTSRPILERWMKEQKGPKVIAKKVFNNLDSYLEILPEIPSFFRRISNHYSGNSSDLTKNFDQLKIIEQKLQANKIRNHYYFSIILLIGIFVAPLGTLDIYKNEILILLLSLMYFTKPK